MWPLSTPAPGDDLAAVPECLLAVTGFYALATLVSMAAPGYTIAGYVCDWRGRPLKYKLNGPIALSAVGALWYLLPTAYSAHAARSYWECVIAANVLGLVASAALLFCEEEPAFRALTVDQKELCAKAARGEDVQKLVAPTPPRNVFARYFFGVNFNPRPLGVDVKMTLYAIGAAALAWNACAAASLRLETVGSISVAMTVYLAMLFWFLFEYMCLESVHLYTYDLFCEKTGFKLCWGCLVFYPFFYCIGVWPLVRAAPERDVDGPTAAGIGALFAVGWFLTRGANMQKFLYKRYGHATYLGVKNELVPGTRLLCTGFWGLSRHVNYLGEILQATALALPSFLVAETPLDRALPWLYPLYYIALFIPRQMDDDVQMRLKYGDAAFGEYVKRVPSRIVPGVW